MASQAIIVSTAKSLGVTPRYVLQHHAISRSIQSLSTTAKKLTVMAMALIPPDLSSRVVMFTFTEFSKALGYGDGGEQYRLFRDAATECMKCVIMIESDRMVKGKRHWEQYTWFSHSSFDEVTGVCTMTFSAELAGVLLELKRVYAKIDLKDLGKLQSKYAIRYFEMAKSYESLAGKDGNREGYWYFERTLPELRELFAIAPEAYAETRDFRKKVIEQPVKELNAAEIGVTIVTEGIKQGRKLQGIRFDCNKTRKTLPAKRGHGRSRKTPDPETRITVPDQTPKPSREETELEHLRELYPSEFNTHYAEALEQQKNRFGQIISEKGAEANAFIYLRKKYGIVK
jgi:plasmid replication initiation protein